MYIDEIKNSISFTNEGVVIIQIGTNDILNEISKGGNCEEIVEEITSKYYSLLKFTFLNSSSKTIITSILPPTENYISSDCNVSYIYHEINNNIHDKVLLYPDIEFVNLYSKLSYDNKFLINHYSNDGLHINKNGYNQMSFEIRKKLF